MPHHYTKSTVEASVWCKKCNKMTPWKIADGRRQFCLVCYAKEDPPRKRGKPPESGNLFKTR